MPLVDQIDIAKSLASDTPPEVIADHSDQVDVALAISARAGDQSKMAPEARTPEEAPRHISPQFVFQF